MLSRSRPRRLLPLAALGLLTLPAHAEHGCFDHRIPLSLHPEAPTVEGGPTVARGGGRGDAKAEKDGPTKEGKWNVDNPTGLPTSEIKIDVREGTWLSLDVSPDGRELVFDLLGDLYRLPIEGGEAKPLTSGMAWDMQPRYSPNGKWIAFTSDRGGGDNLWVMKRDGTEPKAVTQESFRLLNSPAWSPDSEFLVARKHFTAERSLGSGEIWLYHRSGGSGLQLTDKPNDQKDVGEPVFSPDGRYVYFSQDMTPGAFFEYNKDPNAGIYAIRRLDRETGETLVVAGGPGGAVRPTPSPDGKSLAFVRRERGKTVLAIKDLESGRIRPLWDGLDRDMQETWAIHGVYPNLAWTPDSESIVLWAGGGFHRLDVTTGNRTAILFHVRDTRRIAQAVRSPQKVAPERFTTRMLRWVETSPAGDRVLFQTLGHVYLRDLPILGQALGAPRRLTQEEGATELYPSFSRDSHSVVYVRWTDAELGSVRLAAVGGGEPKVLVSEPGHYVEPALSPDGKHVVYRRLEGDLVRSPDWGEKPGLWVKPVDGGPGDGNEEKLLTLDGIEPHFGAENDRVYFTTFGERGSRKLKSLRLDGTDERTHVSTEFATEFQVSPDSRWLAYTERFNAYVIPFVATGRTVEIGPDANGLPQARVSRDAGSYLHWSGDAKTISWSLGPELFSRRLSDAFAFVEGAPKELPKPPEKGLTIGFEVPTDRARGTLALVGGQVITMRGDEVIEDGVVLVEDGRVKAVGSIDDVLIPAGTETLDVTGKTVVPGLIDVHWHGAQGSEEIIPQQNWFNYAALAFGVTTLHDPSNATTEIFSAAELARAGRIVAPRIFSTGTILYGARAPFKAVIDSADDARSHLRRMKAVGAFSVKSYNQPRRDQRQQVLLAARELGMLVVPEGGSLFEHNMTMVVDGHTGIEHTIPVARIYDDVRQLWSQTKVGYTPTLVVGYGGLWGEEYWYQESNVWENQRLLSFVPRQAVDPRSRRRATAPPDEWNHFEIARIAAQLEHLGVGVNLGAHGQREGLAAHWELWMFVQGGMTPHEALRAATLNGARYLGMESEIGSLEPGKLADLIVIDGNPLENIRVSEKVTHTMVGGRLYEAATMNQVFPEKKDRVKFWFEPETSGN